MNEKDFQKKIADKLKVNGYWVYRPNERMRKGIPDIIAIKDGIMYGYELKYTDKLKDGVLYLSHPLAAIQVATLKEMESKGAVIGVIIGFEKMAYFFNPKEVSTIKEIKADNIWTI